MKKSQMKKMAAVGLASATVLTMTVAPTFAMTEHFNDASINAKTSEWTQFKEKWKTYANNYENAVMTPGADASQLNFAWYSKTQETPKVRYAEHKTGLEKAAVFEGKQESIADQTKYLQEGTLDGQKLAGYYSNKVTIKGLKPNTHYYYQIFQNGKWTEAEDFNTRSDKGFSFLYVGDPQIGASKGRTDNDGTTFSEKETAENNLAARNDAFNWNETLNRAIAGNPDVSFIMSAGDQINKTGKGSSYEAEYAGYLGAEQLRHVPVATTIGNHDSGSAQYSLHFNNPNSQERTETTTNAGTDYYFTYNNALFISIDSNNYNVADHENTIKKAIASAPDAKWRIVMFHQDIYGSGYDHSDSDGIVMRTALTPLFDQYKIDVALQGHDHTYSRTYQLTSDGQQHKATKDLTMAGRYAGDYKASDPDGSQKAAYLKENQVYKIKSDVKSGTIVNPEGTVYMEANSATGSKFYNLIPQKQDYISERSQTWTPSYSVVSVDGNSLTIKTFDALTGAELQGSSAYTIVKGDVKTAEQELADVKAQLADAQKNQDSTKAEIDALKKDVAEAKAALKAIKEKKKTIKKQSIKLYAKNNGLKVKVTKSAAATKYQVKIALNKSMTKGVKTYYIKKSATTKTIKNLKNKKRYYVKARTIAGSQKGKYSVVKSVKTK